MTISTVSSCADFAGERIQTKTRSLLQIYPNPSSGIFNITGATVAKYEVYNLLGQLVKSGKINDDNTDVDLSNQSKAIYLLKIIDDSNKVETYKITKK